LSALDHVQARGVDPFAFEHLRMLTWPVRANDADESDAREEAGGNGEMRGGASEQVITTLLGRLNVINGNRSDNY
ncbi:MAG: hypothetical protein RID07_15000, partial [Lacipirellulaceae bacterium]